MKYLCTKEINGFVIGEEYNGMHYGDHTVLRNNTTFKDVTFSNEEINEYFKTISDTRDFFKDNVNPDHYKTGSYQCIDVMIDQFGIENVKTFCKLNSFKYIYRLDKKNGIEDAKKAVWYLNKFIELNGKS